MNWDISQAELFTKLLVGRQKFFSWQQQRQKSSIADAFAELRNLCAEEDYLLEIPQRENRECIS